MTLPGLDPNDPTPYTRRRLLFGAGPGSSGVSRDVLLIGNKSSSGSEAVETIGAAIADDDDARTRFGSRSELYAMYRDYVAHDSTATIFPGTVTEAVGTQASVALNVDGVSNADSTVTVTINGYNVPYVVANGDAIATTADGIAAAINAADEGRLQVTAVSAINGAGPDYNVTVTAALKGVRGDFLIGDTATRGIRVAIKTAGGITNAQTVTKGALVAGAGLDDGSTIIAAAAGKENIYWCVAPWHTGNGTGISLGDDTAVSTTDNHLGELMLMIKTQDLPANSQEKVMVCGLVGDSSESIAVPTDSDINSTRAHFFWAENSDKTPAQIAALHCAILRANTISHPGANITGYTKTDNTIYNMPAPFVASDVPTVTEVKTALNNGVSPVMFYGDRPSLVRWITSRSTNSSGAKDYKAREGHIVTAIDFVWSEIKQRWEAQKQSFVAEDPADGQKPTLNTSTPNLLKKMIFGVIDTMTSSKPLGRYNGPILSPDKNQFMKDRVSASKITAGLTVRAEFITVEHLLKFEGDFLEVGEAY